MPRKKNKHFSLSGILSGHLGALFGVEFSLYLSSPERFQKRNNVLFTAKNFSFEQQKVVNLLQVMENSFLEGKMENVKKYALLLIEVLKDLFSHAEISLFYWQKLIPGIRYQFFSSLGDFLLGRGLAGEALLFYEELLAIYPEDGYLMKKAARAYYSKGILYLSQAEKLCRQVLEKNPEDLEAYEVLGRLLVNFPGREEDSLQVYRDALHYCRRDMDRIRFYLCQLSLFPGDYNILLRLGRLYRRQGMFLESRHYFEEAFKQQPDPWTGLDLGRLCCILNDLCRAKEIAAFLSDNKEPFPPAYYLLGFIDEEEGRWPGARNNYEKVAPDSPLYWEARAGMARVSCHEKNYPEAEELAKSIPVEQRDLLGKELGAEYPDLCELLEKDKGEKPYTSSWRAYLRETEPLYELKKDIRKRNMGAAFWRKYEFREIYADGPAGQVFLGIDRYRGNKVAIKQIDENFTVDPMAIRRFQGILKTLRTLSSPFILPVFEDCYHNERFFFAMEYMEGDSLAKYTRRSPRPLTEVFSIALQVSSALDYLYSGNRFMTHGALKPGNILFSADGKIKLSGFDIIWVLEGTKVFTGEILKKYSSFLGSFLYAAPERFKGKGFWDGRRKNYGRSDTLEAAVQGVDHRADLYSLGAILFELLTGFLPYKENTAEAVAHFHRSNKTWPSPSLFNLSLSADLESIILKLLSRDPYERFATPNELKKAIKKANII